MKFSTKSLVFSILLLISLVFDRFARLSGPIYKQEVLCYNTDIS